MSTPSVTILKNLVLNWKSNQMEEETVAYLSSLEGSREERAFELAKNEYLAWLEHKADRYTTVYGYMD